ncbi:MAG: hypothetical protein Q9203_006297 [Teloschistes exilis]
MLDLPVPEDFKIDPGWRIKPGDYIHHVPDKKMIGKVNKYNSITQHVLLSNNNELLTTIHGLLMNHSEIQAKHDAYFQRILAQSEGEQEGTKAQTEHPMDTDAEDDAATFDADKIRKGAQDNPSTVGNLNNKITPNTEQIIAAIKKTIQDTMTKVGSASVFNLATKVDDLLQTIPSDRATRESAKKHSSKKASPKGHSYPKTPRTTSCKIKSYSQPRSATAKSSAPSPPAASSASPLKPTKADGMSAPWENAPMAPFRRRFQAAPQGSQASSEASFKSAAEALEEEEGTTPGPVSKGEGSGPTQMEAAPNDPYAGIGDFFDARPSISNTQATLAAGSDPGKDGYASAASKMAKKRGEGAAAAGQPAAQWVPPHLRGVVTPKPGAEGAKKEPKKGDWSVAKKGQAVASSHKIFEVPEIEEPVTLLDFFRRGLHADNSEAKKKTEWW